MGLSQEQLQEFFGNLKTDYSEQKKVAESIVVHSKGKDKFFAFTKHLHEEKVTYDWRKLNFVPVTKPAFNRAFSTLSRIFRDSGFMWDGSDILKEYLKAERFNHISFWQYMSAFVMRIMIDDPNGFIAWLPNNYIDRKPNERISVSPNIVSSSRLRFYNGDTLIWLSNEKSDVSINSTQVARVGDVYYCLTDEAFYAIRQYGKKQDNLFRVDLEYVHAIGFVPFTILGGDWQYDCESINNGLYVSFFDSFIHFGNAALNEFSDFQLVNSLHASPIREQEDMDCDGTYMGAHCHNGIIKYKDSYGVSRDMSCQKCGGTGRYIITGPSKVLLRPKARNPAADSSSQRPLVNYISPPIDSLEFIKATAWELIAKAEESLYLKRMDYSQSGVAKQIDQEDMYAFLEKISINYYDNIVINSLRTIEAYINPAQNKGGVLTKEPILIKPGSFQIVTDEQLTKEVDSQTNNLLGSYALDNLVYRKYSGDLLKLREYEFLKWYDPLVSYSPAQKDLLYTSQAISEEAYQKSINAPGAWAKMQIESGNVYMLKTDFETISKQITLTIQSLLNLQPNATVL